ncbi:MAG: FtsQ-type POTRA domain-containing protein [Ruminococcus sp.]|nr:FtsQ-type POTRA domain-containing protein [Ruminococcus sp.]
MSSKNKKQRPGEPITLRKRKKHTKKRRRITLDMIPPRIIMVFGVTAAVVIVVIMSFTLFFNVKQADIKGCELYTYDQVLVMSGVSNKTNLLRMDTDVIEQRLVKGLPYIEGAKVTKRFPDSIDIELTEATQRASLDNDGRYTIVSSQGVVLETDRKAPISGLPVIKGFEEESDTTPGDEIKSKDNLKAKIVKTLLSSIDKLGLTKVGEIDITDRTNIVLRYDDRIDIYIGSSYDMEYKLEQIKYVIDRGVNSSFRGVLRCYGTDVGISARPESAVKSREEAKAAKQKTETKKQEEPAPDTEQAQQQAENTDPEAAEPAAVTDPPAVTTAPPETEPPPPETTTWAGW